MTYGGLEVVIKHTSNLLTITDKSHYGLTPIKIPSISLKLRIDTLEIMEIFQKKASRI